MYDLISYFNLTFYILVIMPLCTCNTRNANAAPPVLVHEVSNDEFGNVIQKLAQRVDNLTKSVGSSSYEC